MISDQWPGSIISDHQGLPTFQLLIRAWNRLQNYSNCVSNAFRQYKNIMILFKRILEYKNGSNYLSIIFRPVRYKGISYISKNISDIRKLQKWTFPYLTKVHFLIKTEGVSQHIKLYWSLNWIMFINLFHILHKKDHDCILFSISPF